MANKSLFQSITDRFRATNATNEAGGSAYKLDPKHALAQIAATGTFGNTFYSGAEAQLQVVLDLIDEVDDHVFLAKLAVYAREKAYMKDMSAALLVALSIRDNELMHRVFDRVVDNGRVLRTVFQMVRSGRFVRKASDRTVIRSRKGLSSSLQRAFRRWFNDASNTKLINASVGNDPSLRDILRMARPIPKDNARRALFGWLADRPNDRWGPASEADLPAEVQAIKAYRCAKSEVEQAAIVRGLRNIRWDLLSDAAKGPLVWAQFARIMGPQALRMNLNTLLRHGVFEQAGVFEQTGAFEQDRLATSQEYTGGSEADHLDMVDYVAARISDESEIRRAKQFPFQYFAAYMNVDCAIPSKIKVALHKAAEIACGNVPKLSGPVVIGLDTSGSMSSRITGNPRSGGHRAGVVSTMRCVDAAALFAAALVRSNPDSIIIPFDTQAYDVRIDPSDSILSLAERLAKYGGGGTDCSQPIIAANQRYATRKFAGAILVSDNESWVGTGRNGSTALMTAWEDFVIKQRKLAGRNVNPKLVCIDLQPYETVQAYERADILNIGGFSDAVFEVISGFVSDGESRFVSQVEAIEL